MYVSRPRPLFVLTTVRLLDLVKFFAPILPEIEFPDEKISLDEKVLFTIGSGLIFVLAQLPIYGLIPDASLKMADPFAALRPVFAMEQASLLELGLLPVISAAFLWQVAAGLRLIKVNFNFSYDRELYQTAQKLTSFVFGLVFAVSLIALGYYDSVIRGSTEDASPPLGAYVLILFQIVSTNFILTLLVEVIDKGYGFCSGILCFLSLHAATGLVRDVVGLELVAAGPESEPQTYGVFAHLIKSLFSLNFTTIKDAFVGSFTRSSFPTLPRVLLAIATGLAVIAMQNFRFELPIRSNRARGSLNVYPLRMLYTGALPVLFAFTVLANAQITLHFFSVLIEPFYPVVSAVVETRDVTGRVVSGVAYYVSSPASFAESVLSPIRAVVYTSSVLILATSFALFWSKISGSAPKDIAKQFKEQSIIIAGKRDVLIAKELSRVIPVASVTGAFVLSSVAVAGELLGASGKTVSVSIGVCAAFAVLEDFMVDFQQSGGASQIMGSLANYK